MTRTLDSTLTTPSLPNRLVPDLAERLSALRDRVVALAVVSAVAVDVTDRVAANKSLAVAERELDTALSLNRALLGLKRWTTPSLSTLADWGPLDVDELRDLALNDESASARVLAAVELTRRGEVVCSTCDDNRWVIDNTSPFGEPWNEVDAPCTECNADGEAEEGEPVCDPALLPSVAPLLVTMPVPAPMVPELPVEATVPAAPAMAEVLA